MSDHARKFLIPDEVSDAVVVSGSDAAQWYGGSLRAENGHEVEVDVLPVPVTGKRAAERPARTSADLLSDS